MTSYVRTWRRLPLATSISLVNTQAKHQILQKQYYIPLLKNRGRGCSCLGRCSGGIIFFKILLHIWDVVEIRRVMTAIERYVSHGVCDCIVFMTAIEIRDIVNNTGICACVEVGLAASVCFNPFVILICHIGCVTKIKQTFSILVCVRVSK